MEPEKKRNASVHSGTTAADTTVNSDGHLEVLGGIADGNTVNSGGNMYVLYGTADNTVVNSGGFLDIDLKGIANGVTANSSGSVHVSSGGTANSAMVNAGGYFGVSAGGTATGVVENGGYVYVEDGAEVTFLPNTFSGVVLNGNDASVHSGTIANDTVIDSDNVFAVFSGGFANGVTVNKDGKLWVYEGGLANGITVGAGGELNVGYGGWITGRMTFQPGAIVIPDTMGTLDFDLTQTAPGETALVNDLSFVPDTFIFTLTVNGAQPDGTYRLAGGAAGFDQDVYVINTSGRTLGTLTVGGSLSTAMADYTLKKTGSDLTLDVTAKTIENGPGEPYNNELYYKKTKGVNTKVTESWGTHLSAPGDDIYLDKIGTVKGSGYCNRVEKKVDEGSDVIDYAKIVLAHGAKLSFHVNATAAATFTVYSLTRNSKGKYKLKKLQTLKLKYSEDEKAFVADSRKVVSLQVSGPYYVSMKFTDRKAEEAYYNVSLNGADRGVVFYDRGDNSDDWGDMKTKGFSGAVADLGVINAAGLAADSRIIKDEWIGFGDKVDCKRFTLENTAELSFTVNTPDNGPLKLTVCKLKTKTTGAKTTYSPAKVKTIKVKANQGSAVLNSLRFEAGDRYFLKVESTNVKKSTGYDVQITSSYFYSDGDSGWNNVLYDKKEKALNTDVAGDKSTTPTATIDGMKEIFVDTEGSVKCTKADRNGVETKYHNFVGFGDTVDYKQIYVAEAGSALFGVMATGMANLVICVLDNRNREVSSRTYKLVQNQDAGLYEVAANAKAYEFRSEGYYYIKVEATDTKKEPEVYYNVMVADTDIPATADALDMPDFSGIAESGPDLTDALSFGRYDADALAEVSASSLAEPADKSPWLNIATLA